MCVEQNPIRDVRVINQYFVGLVITKNNLPEYILINALAAGVKKKEYLWRENLNVTRNVIHMNFKILEPALLWPRPRHYTDKTIKSAWFVDPITQES